ncbi:MAG: penicillin-binding protein 2 [Candidatus Zixiibacteriota bacterium]|jgi:penicillin-binding protein 2
MLNPRFIVAAVVAALVFGVLTYRVADLQVVSGDDFYTLSQQNRLRRVPVRAPRGRIYDRRGNVLAESRPSYAMLWMLPTAEEVPAEALERSARYLKKTPDELLTIIRENREFPYEPSEVIVGLTPEQTFAFEEVRATYPEISVASRPMRYYPCGATACHLLGYVGEIGPERLATMKAHGYRLGDTVGLAGAEDTYEEYLRGRDGYETVEVNALEKKLGLKYEEEVQPPAAGYDLHSTLDLGLQQIVERMLEGRRGAIIVMDPNNGEVWALASSPPVNPNDFAGGIASDKWSAYVTAPDHPLLNRAIQCSYPPGSTFKLVTATAALEEGLVVPGEKMPVPCYGAFRYGNWTFHCWNRSGHGPLDIAGGLKNSCNVFFFQVGLRVGIDNLTKYSRVYGYGSPTGISLPHENDGLIPSRERLEKKWGKKWPRGEVVNNAIGQGQVLLTPVQEIVAFSAFANGGRLYTPRIVTHVTDADGVARATFPPEVHGEVKLDAVTRKTMLRGLIGVVNRYGVNAHYLAGKTGSAENPFGDTHAWFTGFAPAYEPKVAVCILVENGGYGESYIKWAKEIMGYCRENVVGEAAWPLPPEGLTPKDMEEPPAPKKEEAE